MAGTKVRYGEINVGDEIPGFSKEINCLVNVVYQAATWDFARIHYDYKFVESMGFPAPFPDGAMYSAYLAKMVTDWIGDAGEIRKFSFRFQNLIFIDDSITCSGVVTKKYQADGGNYVECSLSVENQEGKMIIDSASVLIEMD
ncbi:MAG: hypothetical protein JRI80_16040 [Deltaproteobacteria bacterium]|nr:hypothetical protein [Deltaproteobacteria bacterium]